MLPRLSPLALVMVAACSRQPEPVSAPDYSACKLVGTWEMDRQISKRVADEMRALGRDPKNPQSILDGLAKDRPAPTYVFRANGECVVPVTFNEGVRGVDAHWAPTSEDPNEVTVAIRYLETWKPEETHTFHFETENNVYFYGDWASYHRVPVNQ